MPLSEAKRLKATLQEAAQASVRAGVRAGAQAGLDVGTEALNLANKLATPMRVRWLALSELWLYRNYWRLPHARVAMRAERDSELAELAPVLLLLSLMAGLMLFVVLPSNLGEQATEALTQLWPLWVVQVAPMLCALTMALLNAPDIALQLTEREANGQFNGVDVTDPAHARTRSGLAARQCVPVIIAHATVCAACTMLVSAFTLVFGLVAELVLAVGDIKAVAAVVFVQVSPTMWLHSLFSGWALGLICAAVAAVYAWPGTQIMQRGLDAHRLGVRAMMVSAVACVLSGVVFNWVSTQLGWNQMTALG